MTYASITVSSRYVDNSIVKYLYLLKIHTNLYSNTELNPCRLSVSGAHLFGYFFLLVILNKFEDTDSDSRKKIIKYRHRRVSGTVWSY